MNTWAGVVVPIPSIRSRKMRLRVNSASESASTASVLVRMASDFSAQPGGMSATTPPMRR